METIKIPFTGINRSIDDGASTDGQTMELINARIKNSMVEPIAKPMYIGAIPVEVNKMYYHSNANMYIGVNTETGNIYAINEDLSSYTTVIQAEDIKDIAFIGNVLCISDSKGIEYALWNGQNYEILGVAPELPDITIQYSSSQKIVIPTSDYPYYTEDDVEQNTISEEDFQKSAIYNGVGFFDNAIDTLNKSLCYIGPCLVRYAFRTSSGTYMSLSPIFIIENPTIGEYKLEGYINEPVKFSQISPFQYLNYQPLGIHSKTGFLVFGTKLYYSFDTEFDLSKWSSIITSIDVFVSPIYWYEKEDLKYRTLTYQSWVYKGDEENSVIDSYTFYKVCEFDLKGVRTWEIDNVSLDNLSLQDKLVEENSQHKDFPSNFYVYNSRLHIYKMEQELFKGYGYYAFENKTGITSGTKKDRDIYVYINAESGISVVKKTISSLDNYISPFISYPDNRAYKMVIQWKNDNNETISRTFELKKHQYLNIAYYINKTSRYESYGLGEEEYKKAFRIDLTENTETGVVCQEQNTLMERPNVLKVSELNNPLSFPAAQTYQLSQGKIIGMQSNTTALSQGQFGQYPLYVFCSDGIYAMQVDTSGETVYSTQSPVSRDVCVNSNSITGIDSAVVFASKRGLMAISGVTVTLLSADMEGYLPSCIDSSPIIPKIAKVAGFENALSTATFNDYIENAFVSYNYQENELIVSNPNYTYAYVYNMNSSSWAKISPNPKFFVNRYPECYGVIDDVLYDMQNNNRTVTTVLVLTKPIKMGTLTHKRILQSALRGVVKRALSDLYLRGEPVMFRGENLDIFSDVGLYILGSNDAEHFTLVSGKESIVDIRDLVTKMNKSKAYKYFMVALAGGVRTDVSLNYMEFIASESFTNRLR